MPADVPPPCGGRDAHRHFHQRIALLRLYRLDRPLERRIRCLSETVRTSGPDRLNGEREQPSRLGWTLGIASYSPAMPSPRTRTSQYAE